MDVAEAVKLTENIFRSVNIALVNELKMVYRKWTSTFGKSSRQQSPSHSAMYPFILDQVLEDIAFR